MKRRAELIRLRRRVAQLESEVPEALELHGRIAEIAAILEAHLADLPEPGEERLRAALDAYADGL